MWSLKPALTHMKKKMCVFLAQETNKFYYDTAVYRGSSTFNQGRRGSLDLKMRAIFLKFTNVEQIKNIK